MKWVKRLHLLLCLLCIGVNGWIFVKNLRHHDGDWPLWLLLGISLLGVAIGLRSLWWHFTMNRLTRLLREDA